MEASSIELGLSLGSASARESILLKMSLTKEDLKENDGFRTTTLCPLCPSGVCRKRVVFSALLFIFDFFENNIL